MAPEVVICAGCGHILCETEGIELLTPVEVMDKYGGRCPECGSKLSLLPVRAEVYTSREEAYANVRRKGELSRE